MAQQVEYMRLDVRGSVKLNDHHSSTIVGQDGDNTIIFAAKGNRLLVVPSTGKTLKTIPLEENYDVLPKVATVYGGKAAMLFMVREKKKMLIHRVVVNLADGTTKTDILVDEKVDRDDGTYIFHSMTQDRKHTALLYSHLSEESHNVASRAYMLDDLLSTIWSKEVTLHAASSVAATDDGTMWIQGQAPHEGEATLQLHRLTKDSYKSYFFSVDEHTLYGTAIANVSSQHVTVCGMEYAGSKKRPGILTGTAVDMTYASGIVAMSYNYATEQLEGINVHTFEAREISAFNDDRPGKEYKDAKVAGIMMMDPVPTSYGSVLGCLERQIHVTVEGNGIRTTNYGTRAALIASIDTLGNFRWTHPIRIGFFVIDYSPLSSILLPLKDDDVAFVQTEMRGAPAAYQPDEPLPLVKLAVRPQLAIYTFTPEGKVTKKLADETLQSLVMPGYWKKSDDTAVFLSGMMKKMVINTFSFR